MKQVVQFFDTGDLTVLEVPSPKLSRNGILVRTKSSLVSSGTERMVYEFAQKSLVQKAKARPDLVRQVLDKARREGILTTFDSVRRRLDQPLPLGYSSSGVVTAAGSDAGAFRVGDRVACAGGGFACHAEISYIPKNLAVPLPDGISFHWGSFATLGAIALQGVRQAEVELGHRVLVIGLGLLGQLTVQILKAAGCTVAGIDLLEERCSLALNRGADAVIAEVDEVQEASARLTAGRGFDAVLITADAKDSSPVEMAGQAARDRAKVVAVGAVGMHIPRKIYYDKELDFRLSRSYGPGRYDSQYEEKGRDYPFAYVRWTEQRNMEAFVELLASGKVEVEDLITHRFPIREASRAYDLISGRTREKFLGVCLEYPDEPLDEARIQLSVGRASGQESASRPDGRIRAGLIGAGNFATTVLIPALKEADGLELKSVCTATGHKALHVARKFGLADCGTNEKQMLADPEIDSVFIATRHDLHARQACLALNAGKHVFIEKPPALTIAELQQVLEAARQAPSQILAVGYNRRFAPMARRLKEFFSSVREPLAMSCRVNAGYIPADHWIQDPEIGGGRIVGEICHFVDFFSYISGAVPIRVFSSALPDLGRYRLDNVAITLEFSDSSAANLLYIANGDKSLPKERFEVFASGRAAVLDDFRRLELFRDGKRRVFTSRLRQDKGHKGEVRAFVEALRKCSHPISLSSLASTSLSTFAVLESLTKRQAVAIEVLPEPFAGRITQPVNVDSDET